VPNVLFYGQVESLSTFSSFERSNSADNLWCRQTSRLCHQASTVGCYRSCNAERCALDVVRVRMREQVRFTVYDVSTNLFSIEFFE